MIIISPSVKGILDEFNILIHQSQDIAIFTRNIELQKQEQNNLNCFIEKANKLAKKNKKKISELELNLISCLIFSANAIKNELSMLVNLKEGEMSAAWNDLIRAQNEISIVACNHPFSDGKYLNGYLSRLDAYEKLIFPQMTYASVGGIIKESKCSICNKDYEECEHLKGKMYNGKLCVRKIHKLELEEVSIVENPANKLCRGLTIERDGKSVDVLTLLEKTKENS